ncbi:MAG: 2',5' RNA ligase family [Bacteroidetes bacterium ADurb.Bin408]|nr:MAG: 2',5' RNA ligase family [Bacteroidetes bacterium ADurb.Bin408]
MAYKRTFIAIKIPLTEELTKVIGVLKNTLHASKIYWINENYSHITLNFLGNTSPEQIETVKKVIGNISKKHKVSEFELTGLGVFKHNGRPAVIWAGTKNYDGLNPLHKLCYAKDSTLCIIAGDNSNMLFLKSRNNEPENLSNKYALPKNIRFSDVIFLSNNRILVSTYGYYAFLLSNRRMIWLNDKFGLNDSTVTGFDYDKKLRLIAANTSGSRYLMKNETKIRNIRFVEIKDTVSTFDEIINYFRQNVQKKFQREFLVLIKDVDFSFRKDKYLNAEEQINLKKNLQPYDIILRRNEMQLTNIGIPGFWTHSGIFIGSLAILDRIFGGLALLNEQSPSAYIEENYPEVYGQLKDKTDLVIEAISEGVVIKPLEHIANSDYLVVLRTHLPKEDRFKSLMTAFEYFNTPYDFLFDFSNDNEVVCSELVYNSFRPHHDKTGVTFKMGEREGKPMLSPNDIARQYCQELKKDSGQLDVVYYFNAVSARKIKPEHYQNDFCKTLKK